MSRPNRSLTPGGDQAAAWNIGSLKEHLETVGDERDRRYQERFDAQEAAMHAALIAAKEAVLKAEVAIGERLTLLNEFRAQSKDEQARYITRTEAEGATDRNSERIQELITKVQTCVTRDEMTAAETRYSERLQVLETRQNLSQGKGVGLAAAFGYIVGAAGAVAAVITIIVMLRGG